MEYIEIFSNPVFVVALVLEFIFKAIALWRCGRNNQPVWYIVLLFINSAGILPAIYLAFFQRRES